jgi:hypothetical protein
MVPDKLLLIINFNLKAVYVDIKNATQI